MSLEVWMCVLLAALGTCQEAPTVTITQGRLQGLLLRSREGREFSAFLGIPYAAPPVGPLRFHKPVPAEPWEGVRDATTPGSTCTQTGLLRVTGVSGSEDCLYLNVYTPEVSGETKAPVLVFIHGGGYIAGKGDMFQPDFFLDKDIVLVTFNYRLGSLGFLSMEDKDLSGNYGLKDQVAALRWVKDNIAQFGGDPESITIHGESAGSSSVHFLMMSPLSKGLFNRAISQTGSALSPWAMEAPGRARLLAQRLAADLSCDHSTTLDTLFCLQELSSTMIANASQYLYTWYTDPVVLFRPSIEPECADGAFITRDPWSLTSGDTPWIAGINSGESITVLSGFNKERFEDLNDDFEMFGPITLMFEGTAQEPSRIALDVKNFYFPNGTISPDQAQGLVNMYSDSNFDYPTMEAFRRHQGPKYFYFFDYRGSNTKFPNFDGVGYFQQMQYFFPMNGYYGLSFNTSVEDTKLSEKLVEMWVNFANNGKPTEDNSWAESDDDVEYLSISNDGLTMDKDLLKERIDFWRALPFRNKYSPEDKVEL